MRTVDIFVQTTISLLFFGVQSRELANDCLSHGGLQVVINEFHYDNDGSDVGEFIEIAGPTGTDIIGWKIVKYNGSNGESYGTVILSGWLSSSSGISYTVEDLPSNGTK